MSVKPPPPRSSLNTPATAPAPARQSGVPPGRGTGRKAPRRLVRLIDLLLSDWWIDVLLMLFIVGSMLYLHQ